MIAKNAWRKFWPLEGVGERAQGVGETTGEDERKTPGSAASIDLGHDRDGRPTDDEVGQSVDPLGRVERELTNGDANDGAPDHDEEQDKSDRAVHGEARDREVATGNGEEDC